MRYTVANQHVKYALIAKLSLNVRIVVNVNPLFHLIRHLRHNTR